MITVHPGEVLREHLKVNNLTQAQLAKDIGVSGQSINDIINGRRGISIESAVLIAARLNLHAHLLLDLQRTYELDTLSPEFTEKVNEIKVKYARRV